MTDERPTQDPFPTSCTLILYDGICGLCNRFVNFLLRHDRRDHFRFAALQSPVAPTLLRRHGLNPDSLDTVIVVVDYGGSGERALTRSDAVLFVCDQLGGIWKVSAASKLLPFSFREWLYKFVARGRYRLFGKYDQCPLPRPADRHKFII